MKTIPWIFTTISLCVFNLSLWAQSTVTGPVVGHIGVAAAVDWCGWNAATPIPFNLEHRGTQNINFLTGGVQRMTIRGTAAGATTGFVGIGTGFANAQSLLHLHQPLGNNVFLLALGLFC